MPVVEINTLDALGVIRDEPGYQLPPEAWTIAENMRVVNGGMERMSGSEHVFGTPPIAPHFVIPISSIVQTFWVYAGLAHAYVYDGVSHTKITRQIAAVDDPYTAGQTRDWNGTILAGIPVLNNGADIPQFWANPTAATKLANLTNWPAGLRARRVIAFGAYLVAMNVLDGATAYPHLVRWSSEVDSPGALPGSWDYTDPAVDAGAYDLPDVNSGVIIDAMPLGGRLFIYKEQSTWAMRRVGGRVVFGFDTVFETLGILASRCVTITGDGMKHVVATQDDIVIHNGSSAPASVLDKRMRRSIFSSIDPQFYVNSFMFTDAEFNEVWFCYPEHGQEHPTRAVIFNYKTGALTESSVWFRNAAVGVIEEASPEVWDFGTDTWDEDTGNWSSAERRRLVLVDPAGVKFHQQNKGLLRNGVTFPSILQRVGLSVLGRKRSGEWIVNHEIMKFVDRIWPKVQGGPIRIRIGFQQLVHGQVTWKDYVVFDPAQMMNVDFTGLGRAVALEFSTDAAVHWRIDGYGIDVKQSGRF